MRRTVLIVLLVFSLVGTSFAEQKGKPSVVIPSVLKKYVHACFDEHIPMMCFSFGYLVGAKSIDYQIRMISWLPVKNPTKDPQWKHDINNTSVYITAAPIIVKTCFKKKDIYGCIAMSGLGMFYSLNKDTIIKAFANTHFKGKKLSNKERKKIIGKFIKLYKNKLIPDFIAYGEKATHIIYHGWGK